MKYITVAEFAEKTNLSNRTIRQYCASHKIKGTFLKGNHWNIPENAVLPQRAYKKKLLDVLKEEKGIKRKGGVYHRTLIDLTCNSNKMEGSRLTYDQTENIFENKTIGLSKITINADDIITTLNHFRCIDFIIEKANAKLTETFIKEMHYIFKSGTYNSGKDWFSVGEYKKVPNEGHIKETCPPAQVAAKMKKLFADYHSTKNKTIENIIDFHYKFEIIHPFQDGNGPIARLIIFKECIANNIVPFIIDEHLIFFYYRGLQQWKTKKQYLLDTCLSGQKNYKTILNYFNVAYR